MTVEKTFDMQPVLCVAAKCLMKDVSESEVDAVLEHMAGRPVDNIAISRLYDVYAPEIRRQVLPKAPPPKRGSMGHEAYVEALRVWRKELYRKMQRVTLRSAPELLGSR
jgi:hypothetical protein